MSNTPEGLFEQITKPLAAEMLTYDSTVAGAGADAMREHLLNSGYTEEDILVMLGFEGGQDEV